MIGKNYLVAGAFLLTLPIAAFSQYDGYDNNEEGEDGYGYGSTSDRDQDRGYESSLGNRYEYDLSDPGDRIMYDVDPGAQLRDSIDVNPERELERGIGEYGGGVIDD